MFNQKEYGKWYSRQYRKDNPEKVKEYNRQYKKDNPEKNKEYQKKWRENHPKESKEIKRQYYKNKFELIKGKLRQYNQTKKGKATIQRRNSKRRTREKNYINTLTADEWIDILKKYHFKCAYCGKEFSLFDRETRDHVIPVSKGGDNIKENIVPACQSCNSKKSNRILID